jgi:hypothetical protein
MIIAGGSSPKHLGAGTNGGARGAREGEYGNR